MLGKIEGGRRRGRQRMSPKSQQMVTEIKRHLLLRRKAMTNLDGMLKSRDVPLLTKVRLVKAIVFP